MVSLCARTQAHVLAVWALPAVAAPTAHKMGIKLKFESATTSEGGVQQVCTLRTERQWCRSVGSVGSVQRVSKQSFLDVCTKCSQVIREHATGLYSATMLAVRGSRPTHSAHRATDESEIAINAGTCEVVYSV